MFFHAVHQTKASLRLMYSNRLTGPEYALRNNYHVRAYIRKEKFGYFYP